MDTIQSGEERLVRELRALYARYGYRPYRMSKFEEYDLYANNRSFLPEGGAIAFTDTNGRLMALKPDVTLSIAKNLTTLQKGTFDIVIDGDLFKVLVAFPLKQPEEPAIPESAPPSDGGSAS